MATQELLLSRTRESQLKEKIKVVEEARSDLEAEVEKLERQMKQLEILSSDVEQLAKVHIHVPCVCVHVCVCTRVLVCVHVCVHECMQYNNIFSSIGSINWNLLVNRQSHSRLQYI